MANLKKGSYDDQGAVSSTLVPNRGDIDLGTEQFPFRSIYVQTAFAAIDLANNTYLKARNAAGSAFLDLLKADASNNTVLNALTAKSILFGINGVTKWSVAPTGELLGVLGETLTLTAGANAKAGTVTLNGTTPVSVATTAFIAGSSVLFSLKTVGGTVGAHPVIATVTPGTGFDVKGTALDTSVYNWVIIDQA